jgi:hypothetical protein
MKLNQSFNFVPLLVCLIGCASSVISGYDAIPSIAPAVPSILSKGTLTGATCTLYSATNVVLATGTATEGTVNFGTLTATGPVSAHCTGGTYSDDALGATVSNTIAMASSGVLVAGQPLNLTVAPLTAKTLPISAGSQPRLAAMRGTDASSYAAMLAAIAKIQNDNGELPLNAVMTTLGHAANTNGTMTSAINALLTTATNKLPRSVNSHLSVQVYVASIKSSAAI